MSRVEPRALADELQRIALAIRGLSAAQNENEWKGPAPADEQLYVAIEQLRERARKRYRERRLRDAAFGAGMFAEPAWDILLDLFADEDNGPCSVSSACIAAAVPQTTALRQIEQMVGAGLLRRRADPADRRRKFLVLTDSGRSLMIKTLQQYADL